MSECVQHRATLWLWSGEGQGSWHFLTIGGDASKAISAHEAMRRLDLGAGRGFGSVKVEAQIGGTSWNTSVFPSKTLGWILPVKASVRKAEGIVAGDEVELALILL